MKEMSTIGTIIISIILAIIWVFIIFEIYNAKEFNDLYKFKEDETNKSNKSNKPNNPSKPSTSPCPSRSRNRTTRECAARAKPLRRPPSRNEAHGQGTDSYPPGIVVQQPSSEAHV